MPGEGVSDEEDFPPTRNANDIFGNINFDEEGGGEDAGRRGQEPLGDLGASRSATDGAFVTPSRSFVRDFYDSRRVTLTPATERPQSPLYAPDKSLMGYDDYDEGELLTGMSLKRRGRRKKSGFMELDAEQLLHRASSLLTNMEQAATNDLESNQNQQPALEKLKMLEEVEEACIHRGLVPILMSEGLLGVLKSWIEPLSDGTLPNIKIRETVLKILLKLPIDTADLTDRKNLKISQIGSRVMFLSRITDETRENKRMAFELIQKWVRPIFEEARREDEEDRIQTALAARKRRLEVERVEEEKRKALKPGDPDFRYVASRPMPNRDYVIKPKSRVDGKVTSGHKKNTVMQKLNKFKRLQRGGK